MTDSHTVEQLFGELHRQYPLWPSTFSTCSCQRRPARGGGKCGLCYEEELARYVDVNLARDIHDAIQKLQHLKIAALERVK